MQAYPELRSILLREVRWQQLDGVEDLLDEHVVQLRLDGRIRSMHHLNINVDELCAILHC